MPSNISPLDKLNGMVNLFLDDDKLDASEVGALDAFYGGLDSFSQQETKPRLLRLYQTSEYFPGQKERFFKLLKARGFTPKDLGEKDMSAAEFLAFPPGKQLEYLKKANREQISAIKPKDVAKDTLARINKGLRLQKQQIEKARPDITYQFGEQAWKEIRLPKKPDGNEGDIIGYTVHWVIVADESAGVDEAYYFNFKGEYLGKEYRGE